MKAHWIKPSEKNGKFLFVEDIQTNHQDFPFIIPSGHTTPWN